MKEKAKSKETKNKQKAEPKVVGTICKKDCPIHGNLKIRGRTFEGKVTSKFPKRIAIEFERMVYVRKYERYSKSKTKIHARLPECMEKEIQVGDFVKIQECRPLSKIIHFVVVRKIKEKEIIAK